MKKSEVKVGGVYRARVSGNFVDVRVEKIRQRADHNGRDVTVFDVLNLATGRRTTFRSAAKLRHEVGKKPPRKPTVADAEVDLVEAAARVAAAIVGDDAGTDDAPLGDLAADLAAEASGAALPAAPAYGGGTVAGYTPTPEQVAILRAVAQPGLKVLVVEAGAGTGKTSTLKMVEETLPGRGQYTAFNASLVADAKTKFRRAAVNTTHSLAFREEGRRFAHRLNGPRVRSEQIARQLGVAEFTADLGPNPKADPADPATARLTKVLPADYLAGQVMLAVKKFCQSADAEVGEQHFRYVDGIDAPRDGRRAYENNLKMRRHLLPFARAAWADLNNPKGTLPYTHDFYVKTWQLGEPYIAADYILLDECQDSAAVLLDVIKRQTHALVVLVGDSAQAIYGWRGAISAMAVFPDAPRTYLSQSFRFGPAIADVANAILNTLAEPTKLRLKGLPSIPSAVVQHGGAAPAPTCILCRTNAAAVAAVLQAIDAGRRPHLIGGGAEVVKFVEAAEQLQRGQHVSHPELACFESWNEVVAYAKEDEGEDLKLLVKLIEEFGCDSILRALRNMPREAAADLVVCTAHKSKGREWGVVKLAPDFSSNDKMGDEDRRLLYVAATRAKRVLDVSECPAFLGPKAIRVNFTAPMPSIEDALGGVAPTPPPSVNGAADVDDAPAPQPEPARRSPTALTKFTWAKLRDGAWGIRGPAGAAAGAEVEVERKNGTKSTETVVEVVGRFADGALYRVRNSR